MRISPRISLSVSPWRTKEPIISFLTFLSGPNLCVATSFAILVRHTFQTKLVLMRGEIKTTNPTSFPNPTVSLSDGRRSLKGYAKKTFASQGNAPRRTIIGRVSSDVLMKEEVSLSASRFPNAFPNAMSEITSRVKNAAFSARSNGLYSVLVEMYFVSKSRTKFPIFASIDCSRPSFSFPAYLV